MRGSSAALSRGSWSSLRRNFTLLPMTTEFHLVADEVLASELLIAAREAAAASCVAFSEVV